jgi:hypothetical protein
VGSGTDVSLVDLAQQVLKSAGHGRVDYVEWPANATSVKKSDFLSDTSRSDACLGRRASLPLAIGIDGVYRTLGSTGV